MSGLITRLFKIPVTSILVFFTLLGIGISSGVVFAVGEPVVSIISQPNSPSNLSTPTFEFITDEVADTYCSVDLGAYQSCTSPYATSPLTEGAHIFRVYASNGDGDGSVASSAWEIDITAPDTLLNSSPTDPSTDSTPSFEFVSNEPGSTFECSVNSEDFEPCTSPYITDPLSVGEHSFEVKAIDEAENIDSTPASHGWTLTDEDTDSDGSSDLIEDAGPNGGDANNDGTPDSEQANVLSYENPVTGEYAVLETTNCISISNFQIGSEAAGEYSDSDYDYPMGLSAFHITCENPGDTAIIRQYFYGIEGNESYSVRKWMNDGSYREIPGYQLLGMPIEGQEDILFLVEYEITDGSEFDDDGEENGVIVDPSGPALNAQTNSTADSESETLADTGTSISSVYLLISSTILLSVVLLSKIRRDRAFK